MKKQINAEEQFQVIDAHSFGVSPAETNYTLNYSVDGYSFTAWDEETPADENLFVINVPKNCYFKLVGNTGRVTIVS